MWNPKAQNNSSLVIVQSQMSIVQTYLSCFIKINVDIIPQSAPRTSKLVSSNWKFKLKYECLHHTLAS
jgi:hypothetical protein